MLLLLDLLMRRALGWLGRGSSVRALELENAVLRHEVRLLSRQRRWLDLRRLDRVVLAALGTWCPPGTGSPGRGRTAPRAGAAAGTALGRRRLGPARPVRALAGPARPRR